MKLRYALVALAAASVLTLTACGGGGVGSSSGGSSGGAGGSSSNWTVGTPPEDTNGPQASSSPETGISMQVTLTDQDGYTYAVSGSLPDVIPVEVDVANAKPGQANVVAQPLRVTLAAVNTTSGRNAPSLFGYSPPQLYPIYGADAKACLTRGDNNQSPYFIDWDGTGEPKPLGSYCVPDFNLATNGMNNSSNDIPAGEQVTYTLGALYSFAYFKGDEATARAVADSFSHPTGWVLVSYYRALDRQITAHRTFTGGDFGTVRLVGSASGSGTATYSILWVSPGITF